MAQRPQFVKQDSFVRGSVIGKYIISGKLGEGSFGKVMLGIHKETQKKAALKFIEMKNTKIVNHVLRETKLQKLLDHPNIVHLYEVFHVPERNATCMVLEHIDGGELFDYIVTRGRVEEKEAIRLFRQMISAIEYCHHNLVIHRDLKPENILLDEHKNAKIMDFGLANMMQAGEFLHTNCGSPIYSSPEILSSKDYIGPEVDIWSLGIILYVMVTGMCPWSGSTLTEQLKNAVAGRFEPPEGVSNECTNLINRILTVDPKKRPTIEEIRHHPWVNKGYSTKPPSSINVGNHIRPSTPDQFDAEILDQMEDYGFQRQTIIDDIRGNKTTSQTFVLYFLMLDHKEKEKRKIQETRTAMTKTWSPSDFAKLKDPNQSGTTTTPTPSTPSTTTTSISTSTPTSTVSSPLTPKNEPNSNSTSQKPTSPSVNNKSEVESPNANESTIAALLSGVGLTTGTPDKTKRLSMNIGMDIFKGTKGSGSKVLKPRSVKKTFLLEKATTKKTVEEVQAEIERTINVMRLPFKQSGLKYSCREEILEDKLKFDVEICKVEKEESIGVSFKRKSGSIFHYKDVVDRFCNTMQL